MENTEVEEVKVEKKPTGGKDNYIKIIMLIAAVIVVVYMVFGRGNQEDSCVIVSQSPFGQSQQQVWTDLDSRLQAKGIAGFDLEVPTELTETYTNVSYRVFSYQISEIIFKDDEGNNIIRIDKAKYCGNDILETDDNIYSVINKVEIDGKEVKERGDGEKFTAISWVDGEYSYGITAYKGGIDAETVEKYVSEIE